MNLNEKLQQDDGAERANARSFRILVGGLIYLSHTRPDISYSFSVVSRFMSNPSTHQVGAAKRILHYVAGTLEYDIWYPHVSAFRLLGFTDSDWADSMGHKKSILGNVFSLGSGAITWSSEKQVTTTLSSSEAEYVAATSAACQCIWLRRILADLYQKQEKATDIFCDNKSSIAMTKNPAFHGRTKHIDSCFHFIRELVEKEDIILKFCNTNEQVVDILTKALPYQNHVYFRSLLGVSEFESRGNVE
ncbi:secreted RxLR effector protein 161-like [Lycium ferocissimum]|uniref:secreted RxLR effector protein 161-like n=1 Tax=Lycium ferocissimum TaxID=112874 RepID=UPI0028162692|nr:secreted RxLR effector protein 161-like [Lycium ferocissimum]XP_059281760.1 secreted RxLR effector protein 161-like [Lycium ferocissimum]XP_059281769.1 secreted RxLR effector protein 161-like [Lycium ferocissimum]XP_059281776.1 secreted RxLR effector protein 161-like [Lycium ferocissimum]XP_059281783.1 secreted RxLR effector protein 161-like [Lycium ferocissimum]XP_059281791.1 secreted RxLR effector protein 161-like [Lycium ferocissimum]XP_059281799.1 secreted RxLR effector protein 161-lik